MLSRFLKIRACLHLVQRPVTVWENFKTVPWNILREKLKNNLPSYRAKY